MLEYINVENVLEQSGEQLEEDDSSASAHVVCSSYSESGGHSRRRQGFKRHRI